MANDTLQNGTQGASGPAQQPRRRGLGGLLSRLFQGRRDGRRAPQANGAESRFDDRGNLRPGQPAQPPGSQTPGSQTPPTGQTGQGPQQPNPLNPGTPLTQEGTQRRQDTRLVFEDAKQKVEQLQQAPRIEGPIARRKRMEALRKAEAEFLRASVEAGTAAQSGDVLSEQDIQDREEGEQLQQRLQQQGGLSAEDLARAQELGVLDQLPPEEQDRIKNTALLEAPTLPGGSGQPLAVDRARLTQFSPIDARGNPINMVVGGNQAGITQIQNPETVDEFLFNVDKQPPETRQKLFQAISRAGGADAIFQASGGNISDALFLFGDQDGGGGPGQFGANLLGDTAAPQGDQFLEAIGVLFGGLPGFEGNALPGTTPLEIPGAPDSVGTSSRDQQLVLQNALAALFQLGFGGPGGTTPFPTGVFG